MASFTGSPMFKRPETRNPYTGELITSEGPMNPDEIPMAYGGNMGGLGSRPVGQSGYRGLPMMGGGMGFGGFGGGMGRVAPASTSVRVGGRGTGMLHVGRFHGGKVKASHKVQPYIVNEPTDGKGNSGGEEMFQPDGGEPQIIRGPEQIFIPPTSGKIIPHKKASRIAKDLGMLPPKHAYNGANVYLPPNDNYDSRGRYQNTTRTLLPPTEVGLQGLDAFHAMNGRQPLASRAAPQVQQVQQPQEQFFHDQEKKDAEGNTWKYDIFEGRGIKQPQASSGQAPASQSGAGTIGSDLSLNSPPSYLTNPVAQPPSAKKEVIPFPPNARGIDHKYLRDMVYKHYGEESKERSDDWLDKIDASENSGGNPMDVWAKMKSLTEANEADKSRVSAIRDIISRGGKAGVRTGPRQYPTINTVLSDGTPVTTNGPDGKRIAVKDPIIVGTSAPDRNIDPEGNDVWHKKNLSPENYAELRDEKNENDAKRDFDLRVIRQKSIEDRENRKIAKIKDDSALREAFKAIKKKRLIQDLEEEKNRDLRPEGRIWAENDWNKGKKLAGERMSALKRAAKKSFLALTDPANWNSGNYME